MKVEFEKYQGDPNNFFNILPKDWQAELLPIWSKHSTDAAIFVLMEQGKIIAGGIVFQAFTEEMNSFKEEALLFLKLGYAYIGYLWVIETRRGENLGSLWLDSLKEYDPKGNFWLTIEEERLKKFYLKNGFQFVKESKDSTYIEWLYQYSNKLK